MNCVRALPAVLVLSFVVSPLPAGIAVAADRAAAAAAPGLPPDVPAYPQAAVAAASRVEGLVSAFFRTGDSPEEVLAFYRRAAARHGWTPESALDVPGLFLARKKDRTLRVDAATNPLDGMTEAYVKVVAEQTVPAKESP